MFLVQVIALDSDDLNVESKNYRCDSRPTAEQLQSNIIDKYARRYLAEDWDDDDETLNKISDKKVAKWKKKNGVIKKGNTYIYGFDAGHAEVNIIELGDVITADTVNTVKIETPYAY